LARRLLSTEILDQTQNFLWWELHLTTAAH